MIPSIYFSKTLELQLCANSADDSIFINLNMDDDKHFNSINLFRNFLSIISERIYLFSALTLSNLFFIITAVQYWASDYLSDVILETNKDLINLSFIIICVTSPTLGIIIGGLITLKTGGYEAKHSILICLIFAVCAAGFSIPVPWMNNIYTFTIFLWLVLFFGAAILPSLTGIMISSLPVRLRGSANSITSIFSNLFGYLPAPYVYGSIYQYTKNINNRIGFCSIMYSSFIGVILISITSYYRYRARDNKKYKSKHSVYTSNVAKCFGRYIEFLTNYITLDENELRDIEINEGYVYSKKINLEKYRNKENDSSSLSSQDLTLYNKKNINEM
jgi:MFS family permease